MLVATVGCWMAVLQKRKAKEQMERMIKDMKILQQAEDGLQELQTRYVFETLSQGEVWTLSTQVYKWVLVNLMPGNKTYSTYWVKF